MSQSSKSFSLISVGNTLEPSSDQFIELSLNDQSQFQSPKTNPDVPLKVEISCLHSTLSLDLSCMGAPKQEFAYKRFHVLVQDDPKIPECLIQSLIHQVYDHMDCGDLIRLVQTDGKDRWLEKVHLKQQHNFKQRSSEKQSEPLTESLERTFRSCQKYPSAYNVVVVLVSKDGHGIKQIVPQIKKLKQQHKYNSHLTVFTTKQQSLSRVQYSHAVSSLQTISQLNFKRKVQLLFSYLNQIRIRSLTLKMEPLYGSFTYIGQSSEWHWEQSKLVRNLCSLRNNQKYTQKIKIQGLPRNTEMFVEVEFVCMTGQTFTKSACLKIVEPSRPCQLTTNQQSYCKLPYNSHELSSFSGGTNEGWNQPLQKVKFLKNVKVGGQV